MVRRLITERFGRPPCGHVHPDEAVALGAARVAHGFVEEQAIELTDVLPASIRVGLRDGSTAVLLPRGTRLPAEKTFEVALSGQAQVRTKVVLYRGEAPRVDENTLLGHLAMPGVPADATGTRKAYIIISVSADGLLSARAEHPALGSLAELDVLLL